MAINITLVRSSFELVKPVANLVADRFYEVLFEDFPAAKELFVAVDMPKQKNALIGSLVAAVNNLDKPEVLTKFLLNLGANHSQYGVEDIHYQWVGQSLIKALSQCLGSQWTQEVENQWVELYGIIAEAMKAGAARTKTQRVRLVQSEGTSQQNTQSLPKEPLSSLSSLSSLALPEGTKQHIRAMVHQAVEALIQAEIRQCMSEQIDRIAKMTPDELIKRAG